jgi:hypothetical protein
MGHWGDGWHVLANGSGVALDELRPCSCGHTIKLVTRSEVFCPRCCKRKPDEPVLGWFDVTTKVYSEGVPPR